MAVHTHKLKIPKSLNDERLDLALTELLPDFSRRKVRRLIDEGACFVGGKRVRMASKPVFTGQQILLHESTVSQKTPIMTAGHVIFEHDDFLAVNKPAGVPSQPTKTSSQYDVCSQLKKIGYASSIRLIHRLDQPTSGLLLVAKNKAFAEEMVELFRQKKVKKFYRALSQGRVPQKSFEVDAALSKTQPNTGLVRVLAPDHAQAKDALTRFELVKSFDHSRIHLLNAFPITGRTHQIRVHLAHVGLPIVGDRKYSQQNLKTDHQQLKEFAGQHMFLHAYSIKFLGFDLVAELPEYWQSFV